MIDPLLVGAPIDNDVIVAIKRALLLRRHLLKGLRVVLIPIGIVKLIWRSRQTESSERTAGMIPGPRRTLEGTCHIHRRVICIRRLAPHVPIEVS